MKKIIIALAAILMMAGNPQDLKAQGKYGADSAQCLMYLSYYREYFKQKSYDDATRNWRKAYEICPPTCNQQMLADGASLMRKLISKNAKNPIYREALVDTLMTLHNQRIQYFPKSKSFVTAVNNKGLDVINYIKEDDQRAHALYNEVIEVNKEKTSPNILIFSLNTAISLYKTGLVDEEEVISIYERNAEYLEAATPKNDIEAEEIANAKNDLEQLFAASQVASCEKLIELYTPRFDAAPEDGELAAKILRSMSRAEDCMDNTLFLKAATTNYRNNPSAASAYFLYRLNSNSGKVAEAIKYMEESIAFDSDDANEDAEHYCELAAFCYKSGKAALALDYVRKCVAADKNNVATGRAYLLAGTIWANAKCTGNEIQTRAKFWVAVDYLVKARKADASLADEAAKQIAQFSQYFPQTAEAFMYDVQDGQTYEVNCGDLHDVTTVRTQK